MKESEMLKRWVREQMDEASKHRDKEGKILGEIYNKMKPKRSDNTYTN